MNNRESSQDLIIRLNQEVLDSVCQGDWSQYQSLCHPDLTCFEAETEGHLVEGLSFHRFYFPKQEESSTREDSPKTVTMIRPHVRWLGEDAAVLIYTRLTQQIIDGEARTATCCETRIWERRGNDWGLVHVHRS